jgi:hypothetical protein
MHACCRSCTAGTRRLVSWHVPRAVQTQSPQREGHDMSEFAPSSPPREARLATFSPGESGARGSSLATGPSTCRRRAAASATTTPRHAAAERGTAPNNTGQGGARREHVPRKQGDAAHRPISTGERDPQLRASTPSRPDYRGNYVL